MSVTPVGFHAEGPDAQAAIRSRARKRREFGLFVKVIFNGVFRFGTPVIKDNIF
jgi:hypothetical protein